MTHYDHSYVIDLMDRITDLQPEYHAEWLREYTPYRLGSALGRWDAEYQYWRGVHEKLRHFNESTKEGDTLPKLRRGDREIPASGRQPTSAIYEQSAESLRGRRSEMLKTGRHESRAIDFFTAFYRLRNMGCLRG